MVISQWRDHLQRDFRLHLATAVDDPFRPFGELLNDLQPAARGSMLVGAERDGGGAMSRRVADANSYTATSNRELDSDCVARAAAVPDSVGDQFTRHQQSIRSSVASYIAEVEQLCEQASRNRHRVGLGRQCGASFNSWTIVCHLTEATRHLQFLIRPSIKGLAQPPHRAQVRASSPPEATLAQSDLSF